MVSPNNLMNEEERIEEALDEYQKGMSSKYSRENA